LAQDYKRQDRGKKNKNFDDLDNWKAAKEERESGKLSITHVIITRSPSAPLFPFDRLVQIEAHNFALTWFE
jgi:hypothetical protein